MSSPAPSKGVSETFNAYMHLSRLHMFPMGSLLVFWPAAWGLALAAFRLRTEPQVFARQNLAFLVGSTLLHSAACTINDICDRDFDRQVERSKTRPLPSGRATVFGASLWTIAQTLGAIAFLGFTNEVTIKVGLIGIFPLHALYPLMKRWTYWPQAWLGLAMNWGLPVAWIAAFGTPFDMRIVGILFVGTICWTIFYDTIYACQDRRDDLKAGVKSTAILFGSWIKPILGLFAGVFVATLAAAGYLNGNSYSYFVLSVGGTLAHFIQQLVTLDVENPADCKGKFQANHNTGYIIWAGMLTDYYFALKA